MKIYHFEPKNCGTSYTVLAETQEEAMKYIHEYTYQAAYSNPFGIANNGSHFLTGYMEEFIKWRHVPTKLEGYDISSYDIGQVLITSIEY